jgi:branched-chain amino acid aminotransferase
MNDKIGARVWLNGAFVGFDQARMAIHDRGLSLGDGLFETMLWTGTTTAFLDAHLVRLRRSADALKIALPYSDAAIGAMLGELAQDAGGQRAVLRLTLTRGSGPRGLALPDDAEPSIMASLNTYRPNTLPVKLVRVSVLRNPSAPSCQHKTLSYIDNVMALAQAREQGGDDGLMYSTHGYAACATAANLIIKYRGKSLTSSLGDGAMAGIIRGQLLSAGLIEEATITAHMIEEASCAALTNAIIGVRAVQTIDARALVLDQSWLLDLRQILQS